jgi:adenylate cyclase
MQFRETAGVPVDALPGQEVAIRGRAEPMIVRIVANAKVLSALVENVAVVAA